MQTEKGDWYFFTHHGRGDWEGRCDSLLPVTWIDGWPIIGQPDDKGIGHFVWSGKKPVDGTPLSRRKPAMNSMRPASHHNGSGTINRG